MKSFNEFQIQKWRTIKLIGYTIYIIGILTTVLYFNIALLPTFLIVLFSSFVFLIDLADNKQKKFKQGEDGELAVEKVLQLIPNIQYYRDVSIGEEGKWNIDFVVVSGTQVFVLEVKAYGGRICSNGDMWYQYINGKRRTITSFSNQAKSHSANLIKFLKAKYPDVHFSYFHPLVVLTMPFDDKDIMVKDSHYLVAKPEDLTRLFQIEKQAEENLVRVFEQEFGDLAN